ncbi:MAG: hypothetical protein GDA50_08520 [Alphaproteobacteria bacterium GM202ARS2]|nr:hypothetical protein [Alphaproteobacteria bacterium GM202ARS2]
MERLCPKRRYFTPLVALVLPFLNLVSVSIPRAAYAELLMLDERGGLAGVYFYRDKTPDSVEVYLAIKSGGFDEGDAPEGLAPYLEHLVWPSAVNPDGRLTTARHDGA